MNDHARIPHRVRLGAALGLAVALAGCVSEGSSTRGPREVNASAGGREPPPSYRRYLRPAEMVERITFAVTPSAEDQDGDGLPDTLQLVAYMFTRVATAPEAITAAGEWRFRLTTLQGEELDRWVFSEAQSAAAVEEQPIGPVYGFGLRMRRELHTRPTAAVRLSGTFVPSDGSGPIRVDQPVVVRVGLGNPAGL